MSVSNYTKYIYFVFISAAEFLLPVTL